MPDTPGFARVLRLLAGVSLRRLWNRLAAGRRRKRTGPRAGTARKGGRSTLVAVIFLVLMLFNSVQICTRFVRSTSRDLEKQFGGGAESTLVERLDRSSGLWPDERLWLDGRGGEILTRAVGLLLAALLISLFFMGLSSGNQELAQVGWSMEWLFTFPVSTRSLFLARVGEYAATNVFAWLTVAPLLFVYFVGTGHGAWSLPWALLGTVYCNALIGAARLLAETWLRKRRTLTGLKNLQALATVIGILSFFAIFLFAASPGRNEHFVRLAAAAPDGLLVQPLSAPVLAGRGAGRWLLLPLFGAVCLWLALRACEGLVRDGLITVSGGPVRGRRGRSAGARGGLRQHGLLGKEFLLLRRDRNFMVQTLVVPVLLIVFWSFSLAEDMTTRYGTHARAVAAFVAGAYVLMYGGFSVLATEIKALWLLFTLPHPLDRLLRRKALLWAATSGVYAATVLAIFWRPEAGAGAVQWLSPLMALGGMLLFAFLAGGLGVLGTDPFAIEAKRRIRPEWAYLYLLLLMIYAHGVGSNAWNVKLGMLAFVGVLAFAFWDRVADRLPLLLDPTARPQPRLTMTEGVVCGLLFLELTQIWLLLLGGSGWPRGAQLVTAYALSGLLSVLTAFYMLRGLGRKGILRAVGMQGGSRGGVVLGALAGAAAAGAALAYLGFAGRFEGLRRAVEQARQVSESWDASLRWWLTILVVVLAPLFEEFIFRGLIFRAMRRRLPLIWSVAGSAGLFALVHPPVSWLPVFVLGAASALVLEKTGQLRASVATHMAYNAIIVATQT